MGECFDDVDVDTILNFSLPPAFDLAPERSAEENGLGQLGLELTPNLGLDFDSFVLPITTEVCSCFLACSSFFWLHLLLPKTVRDE